MTIAQFKTALKAAIDADAYFSDVAAPTPKPLPVLIENQGEIGAKVQQAVDLLGTSILVTDPDCKSSDPAKPRILGELLWIIQITQSPMLAMSPDGPGKAGFDIALELARVLHHFQTGDLTRLEFVEIKRQEIDEPVVHWVTFRNQLAIKPARYL